MIYTFCYTYYLKRRDLLRTYAFLKVYFFFIFFFNLLFSRFGQGRAGLSVFGIGAMRKPNHCVYVRARKGFVIVVQRTRRISDDCSTRMARTFKFSTPWESNTIHITHWSVIDVCYAHIRNTYNTYTKKKSNNLKTIVHK